MGFASDLKRLRGRIAAVLRPRRRFRARALPICGLCVLWDVQADGGTADCFGLHALDSLSVEGDMN